MGKATLLPFFRFHATHHALHLAPVRRRRRGRADTTPGAAARTCPSVVSRRRGRALARAQDKKDSTGADGGGAAACLIFGPGRLTR